MKLLKIKTVLVFLFIGVFFSCKKSQVENLTPPVNHDSLINIVKPDTLITNGTPVLRAGIHLFVINHDEQGSFHFSNDSTLTVPANTNIQQIQKTAKVQTQTLVDSIEAGDFVMVGHEANFSNGLLAEITVKQKTANGWSFIFSNTGLENIFSFLDVNWDFTFSDDYLFNKEFSKVIPITTGVDLNLTGNFTFNLGNKINIKIEQSQLQSCTYEIDAGSSAAMFASVTGQFSLDKTYLLYELPSITKTVFIPIGPIAIPLVLTLNSDINLKVNASGNMELSGQIMSVQNQSSLNFDYTGLQGVQTSVQSKNTFSLFNPATFTSELNGSIETGIYLDETLNFYKSKSIGVNAGVGLYNLLTGNCASDSGLHIIDSIGGKAYIGGTIDLFVKQPHHQQLDLPIFGEKILDKKFNDLNFCSQPLDTTVIQAGSSGDVHFITPNGHHYDFQAEGEFTALKTDGLQIQCRQQPLPNLTSRIVTLNTALAVQTGNDQISFQVNPMAFYVNHAAMPLTAPIKLAAGGSVNFNQNQILVQCASGDKIKIIYYPNNGYLDYRVSLVQKHLGKISGILGDWNGDPVNDVQINNGLSINASDFYQLYPGYANSWRITDQTSLFVYDAGKTTESYTDLLYPYQPVQLTPAQISQAQTICQQAGITTNPALCNCITDVAVTGNSSFTESAANYQADFSGDSLIAYFPFDGDATDHSNYGNHDTLSGNYSFTTDRHGISGKALSLNGSNLNGPGFVSIANNPFVMPLTNQITISAWVNVRQWDKTLGSIVCKSLGENHLLQLQFSVNTIFSDGGLAVATTPYPLQINTWYHIALVIDGTQRSFYLNGVKIGEKTGQQIIANNSPFDIGRDVYGVTEYMIGSLDDVRIYSKALSDAQINDLYQN